MSAKYILILYDRDSGAQITAAFNDINSIDQIPPKLVKQLKIWNEQNGEKKAKIDTSTAVEQAVKRYVKG